MILERITGNCTKDIMWNRTFDLKPHRYAQTAREPKRLRRTTYVLWKMHWAILTMGKGGLEYREPSSFSSRCGTRKTSKTENHMRLMPSSSAILCCRLQIDMALRNNCTARQRGQQARLLLAHLQQAREQRLLHTEGARIQFDRTCAAVTAGQATGHAVQANTTHPSACRKTNGWSRDGRPCRR
jgi:hypothetical protein